MQHCPRCGLPNINARRTCKQCGTVMDGSVVEATMPDGRLARKCPQCGALNPMDGLNCAECGSLLRLNKVPAGGCSPAVKVFGFGVLAFFVLVVAVAVTSPQNQSTPTPSTGASAQSVTPSSTRLPSPTITPTAGPDRSLAKYVDPRELAADPNARKGQMVYLQGRALKVQQVTSANKPYTWINLMANVKARSISESIIVTFEPKDTAILSDECYVVYGIVGGTIETKNTFTGATNNDPWVSGFAWERVSDEKGYCPAFN